MLQQTRVEHVIPYYSRFLERFPTPAALAASPVEEALALWSGLGYYRRVRLLHRAAQQVARDGGAVPADPTALRRLAGVGDYTAAAIASIAFDVPIAVLDGNVERVLCRRLGLEEDPARSAPRRELRAAAAALLDPACPGDGNQALMELGATICTPLAPRCTACPLAHGCVAHARGIEESLPVRAPRRATVQVRLVAARVERRGRVLMFRRPAEERVLPGTWELPWVRELADAADAAALEEALAARYGARFALGGELGRVRHAITFRRLSVAVYGASLVGGLAEGSDRQAAWFDPGQWAALPLSSLVRKALALPHAGSSG
jgi:A/G-specific adenine glycosylase